MRRQSPTPRPASAPSPKLHAAVARIIVPERGAATSYGSGTLVDVREDYGLVITNWHVVRDAAGTIDVVFPGGFRSTARAIKADRDWDLAALVIWRPPIDPVPIAAAPPRPGDALTIAGHGQGAFRAVSGTCVQYVAPAANFPHEMVEVSVQARQGDSGGPILNAQGELAGVLFGAGRGFTLGSYGGRVRGFLASIVTDPGNHTIDSVANTEKEESTPDAFATNGPADRGGWRRGESDRAPLPATVAKGRTQEIAIDVAERNPPRRITEPIPPDPGPVAAATVAGGDKDAARVVSWRDVAGKTRLEQLKSLLAAVGVMALVVLVLKLA